MRSLECDRKASKQHVVKVKGKHDSKSYASRSYESPSINPENRELQAPTGSSLFRMQLDAQQVLLSSSSGESHKDMGKSHGSHFGVGNPPVSELSWDWFKGKATEKVSCKHCLHTLHTVKIWYYFSPRLHF